MCGHLLSCASLPPSLMQLSVPQQDCSIASRVPGGALPAVLCKGYASVRAICPSTWTLGGSNAHACCVLCE